MAKQIVRLALQSMEPDPTQYKTFDFTLAPVLADDLMVEFEIDDKNVIASGSTGRVILTADGLCDIADQMRKAIIEWHWSFDDHVKKEIRKAQTGGKKKSTRNKK